MPRWQSVCSHFNPTDENKDPMIARIKGPRFRDPGGETDIQEKDKKKAKNDKAKYENEKSVKRRSQSQSQPRQSQVKAKSIYNFRD
ncbi:hypothetical protein Tco_0348065 [Tanacetum coccineum]